MINHFISSVRNRREFTDMDTIPEVAIPAAHEDSTALRELGWALDRLPPDQREALFMIVLQEKIIRIGGQGHRLRHRNAEKPSASRPPAAPHVSYRRGERRASSDSVKGRDAAPAGAAKTVAAGSVQSPAVCQPDDPASVGELFGRVFVAVLGVDRLATHEVDGVAIHSDRLLTLAHQMHLDATITHRSRLPDARTRGDRNQRPPRGSTGPAD